jgi:hypothetical protein
MTLAASVLSAQLLPLFNSETTPDNVADCASAWADAIETYSTSIDPSSTAVTSAATALDPLLVAAFTGSRDNSEECDTDLIQAAFDAWAKLIATGMAGQPSILPAGEVKSAIAPTGKIGFCSIGTQDTYTEAATAFADKIDTWVKTGTAVIIVSTSPTVTAPTLWK